MVVQRTNFRAIGTFGKGEDPVENERRFRASVETAFITMDGTITRLARRVQELEAKVTTLETTVSDHEARIAALEAAP